MRFLADKYTFTYIAIVAIFLVGVYRQAVKGNKKSSIMLIIAILIHMYVFLSIHYKLK